MITNETRRDANLGKYLMYVYKYYINLINQLQSKNRQNKLDSDRIRKDDQIYNLSRQIQIRDTFLEDMKQKIGKHNRSFNFRRLINLEELNLDPCLDLSYIKREDSLKKFAKDIKFFSQKRISRNSSIPIINKLILFFL